MKKIKIATVYISRRIEKFEPVTMDTIRWLRISEGLAKKGYQVDMIINEAKPKIIEMSPNLRRVPYSKINWQDYDVIKTLFHEGFRSLEKTGGSNHPFIICKTPVVDPKSQVDANLKPWSKWYLLWIQGRINQKAKLITVLNQRNKIIWEREYGKKNNILIIPTGVDKVIPQPQKNPYQKIGGKIVLFAGFICGLELRKVNIFWQERLNNLGKMLYQKGIHLCFVGSGLTDKLEQKYVHCFEPVPNEKFWNYQYFADCGIVLADAPDVHNESSKIYYYLRTGLPVVSESPIPNNYLIQKSKLGFISPFDNNEKMTDLIVRAVNKKWNKKYAIDYILKNHTWDQRVDIYNKLIRKHFKVI